MDYCGPRGLPYSEFLKWNEYDRAAALYWMYDQAERCGQCGTYMDEWINPKTLIPLDPPPYMVRAEICIGCQALDEERRALPEGRAGQYRLHFERYDRQVMRRELLRRIETESRQPEA